MLHRAFWGVALTAFTAVPAFGQAGGMSDITVISSDIGHFVSGNKIIHVFENSRNQSQFAKEPTRWQFVIEPLLSTVPDMDPPGIAFLAAKLPSEIRNRGKRTIVLNRHRVLVPLNIVSDGARDQAIRVINHVYPEAQCKVTRDNVDVLPLTRIDLNIPDIEDHGSPFYGKVKIHNKSQAFLTSPSTLFLSFDVTEQQEGSSNKELLNFLEFMPFMQLNATLSFSVKGAAVDIASVSSDKLKSTTLYVKLLGDGRESYVTRDDLRNLAMTSANQLQAFAVVEDSSVLFQDLFKALMDRSTPVNADEAFFTKESTAHTYDGDDLKPSVIKEWINKLYTKDQSKDQWKLNSSSSGGGSFFDILKADSQSSYNNEGLKEYLHEHNLDVEITGNIIEPKSINLQQINISDFVANYRGGLEIRNLEKGAIKSQLQTTIFGAPAETPPTIESLNGCEKSHR